MQRKLQKSTCVGVEAYFDLDIRIRDEKPDYGEEAGEEMILHYT